MSQIKDKATQLKEIAKKFGYELKHTHALEMISQLDNNTNRHVALKKEKKVPSSFSFDNAPYGIDTPFYQGYVIEIKDFSGEENVDFFVTNEKQLCLETILSFSENIKSLRFLTEEEVTREDFSFRLAEEDEPVPYKSLLEWINKRAKESGFTTFMLCSEDYFDNVN